MFAEMCDLAERQTQVKLFPSTPAGMAEVRIMIMQHFSHYMCYYYIMNCHNIMSGINKVLNVISYYIITLCAKPLLRCEPLIHYESLLHYKLQQTSMSYSSLHFKSNYI